VRVYLASTLTALPSVAKDRRVPGGAAYAVTPALREWYASGDDEELEYVALLRAARQSLSLLADEVRAPRRRVVLAADIPERTVNPEGGEDPAAVLVAGDIPLSAVQAVHVDDATAVPLVRAALVDPDDQTVQADLEDRDLLWYATQELDTLLEQP
jgi:glycine/D-amino acid oxidase-like deaminating enzyme